MNFQVPINLNKFELQNARIQNLAVAPSSPVVGQIYYNTASNSVFFYDGSAWIDSGGDIRDVIGSGAIQVTVNASTGVATVAIVAATSSVPGTMSATDFTKLGASTAVNTASTIVQRDGSGNFAAGQITATKVMGLSSPTNPSDAATKDYVDLATQGLDAKASVRAATTANITLSGAQTIDGVSVVAGNRVLVKNQTTVSQNGLYVAASGAWQRVTDLASGASASGVFTFVEEGTTNADSGWLCISDVGADVVGTNNISFTQFSGAGQITAGNGLTKTGNTIDVIATDTSLTIAADSMGVNVDNSTIEISSGLRVKDNGITAAKITSAAIGTGLTGGSGTAISVQNYTPVSGTTVARVYTSTINIGGGTPVTVTHNLNTRFVDVQIQDATTNEVLIADIVAATVNTVQITGAGTTLSVRVTIIG